MLASSQAIVIRRPHAARAVVVRAEGARVPTSRRSLLGGGILSIAAGAAIAGRADARDYKAALAQKEARKAKLRETASGIKNSGKDQQVFRNSEYSVGEEARTPNVHSRQNEGARTQENI